MEDFKDIQVADRRIAVIHGKLNSLVDALIQSQIYDVVIRGHNHKLEIKKGNTLMINPGECCGYLTDTKTMVLLDPQDLSYDIIEF